MSIADNFDSVYNEMSLFDQNMETSKAQMRSELRSSSAFISSVERSMELLRRNQRQDDLDAEAAIHHFQALSSPVVGVLSTIIAGMEKRHARIDGIMDRLRGPLAKALEVTENIRRRMLDEKPIDDIDNKLLSSFTERLHDISVIQQECNAEAHSTDDLPDIPAFPENFVKAKAIVEALEAAAAQVVKRPK
ncbi:MAG TPA: hypothetical protein VK620_00410 [Bradyrhizobium sp.]|nr:hypothetical protein [Bradyrhizobium sp.]